jgi:hypothetical protein
VGYLSGEDKIKYKMADDTRENIQKTSTEAAVETPKRLPNGKP